VHELALTESIVSAVCDCIGAGRVRRVVLEVGRLSGVVPDALRFCFDVCAADTVVAGASLDIREIPGLARCAACGGVVELDFPFGLCPCGSAELEVLQGRELRIKEVEVD
jgi:hydrogenase nickel incorporation protein HypA/HybF